MDDEPAEVNVVIGSVGHNIRCDVIGHVYLMGAAG